MKAAVQVFRRFAIAAALALVTIVTAFRWAVFGCGGSTVTKVADDASWPSLEKTDAELRPAA